MAEELSTRYDASQVEAKWYSRWEEAGLFRPSDDPRKPVFSIAIPPPNITGSLHMGHSLCYPVQDVFGRYQRLRGKSVLVLPGQDHAGIATQSVVDKQLKKEGLSSAKLGRENFLERVWAWRKESGDTIINQFRSLGCAFDWGRLRFTLDDAYAGAVLDIFIDWFDRGLIYRGLRVVNWDPILQTSVSDIETERKTVQGKLYHVRYLFADGGGEIVVATTRPETILADVAVAVNPKDARYKGMAGRLLVLPLTGREVPLIEDLYPDPEFGTGAVKITPAHDANDYEVGVRHGLEMPVVIDGRGRMGAETGKYAGLDRLEARKRVVEDLDAAGLLLKVDDYEVSLLVSERSGEPIEPLLSEQWFVRQTELAKPALEAVRSGKVRFVPERYNKVYLDWMENIRDWNISRQLWWGHRVPVYYADDGTAVAAKSQEEAESKLGKKIVSQDENVLDTWFSSGLWPFATLGWPKSSPDLERYYPTSLLVTDRNIIYLWVARMIMMGLDQMKDIPFSDVYIHATVLTESGQRMSKSLGTGVDPTGVIERVGADALRYTLLSQAGSNQEIRYSERRVDDARNFCNKIWNASRFVMMNLEGFVGQRPDLFEPVDEWILSRLARAQLAVEEAYDSYDIQAAAAALYQFFWSEFCDWYIEATKPRLLSPERRSVPQWVCVRCLDVFLKLMHPIMPHLTEEVYSHLPAGDKAAFLMAAEWPQIEESAVNERVETAMEDLFEAIRSARALRAELGATPGQKLPALYVEGPVQDKATLGMLAWFDDVIVGKPAEKSVSTRAGGLDLHLPMAGLVDVDKELERLARESEKLSAELAKLKARLDNPMFMERAKPDVVEKERNAAAELELRQRRILEQMASLRD